MFNFIFLVLFFISCGAYADNTIMDACGRSVSVPESPKKIAAIGPGATALTIYADMSKLLVAKETSRFYKKSSNICSCSLPDNYENFPVVYENAPGNMPDYKILAETSPDLVIASGFSQKQVENIQKNTKAPVAAVNCSSEAYMHYDLLVQSIRLTGYILNKEKIMQGILNYLAQVRKDLYERTKSSSPKKVFIISAHYGMGNNFISEKCYCYLKLINLSNSAPSKNPNAAYGKIEKEELLKIQPEFIFVEYNLLNSLRKDYMTDKAFYKKLKAVNAGKVFTILPYNHYSANLESMLINSYYIGKTVFPGQFADIDLHQKADELSEEMTGNDVYQQIINNTAAFRSIIFDDKGISLKR